MTANEIHNKIFMMKHFQKVYFALSIQYQNMTY